MESSLRREDGTHTSSDRERTELLLRTHFPGSRGEDDNPQIVRLDNAGGEIGQTAACICTTERIRWALGTFQPYKSPGVDGIYPAFLQKGIGVLIPYLLRICRASLALGYIPTAWRRARATFIPKVGKGDMANPKSFRPISLTSFVLKALEKVVDNYIRCGVLQRVPLHCRQHAYRAGRSTETALAELVGTIQKSLDDGETAVCAFLDIEGAFDNTPHGVIERAMIRRGVDPVASRWMAEVLHTRSVETGIGDGYVAVRTTRGCPQGGVLSPLMWSLVVDELLIELSEAGIDCQGYADDIVLIVRGKFEDTICDIIQRGLGIVGRWCRLTGLNINPSKTTIVPFTKRRKLPLWRDIRLLGEVIPPKGEVKYLGIVLDSKLTWKSHVDATSAKATRAIMACRRLAGRSWGCNPKILYWMYIMMVRPMVTYGAVIWWKRANLGIAQKVLEKIQRLACIGITGAMRTSPTMALETLLDLSPLHLVVRVRAMESMLRISRGTLCTPLEKWGKSTGQMVVDSIMGCPWDRTERIYDFEKRFTVELSNKDRWSSLEAAYSFKRGTIFWYTDGSKTESGTGAGVFGPRKEYSEPMGKLTSIFQAEVYAIERCAQFNLDRRYKGRDIAILSDSQAAIRALGSYEVDSRMVWDCLGKLNQLGRDNRVRLCWVPGHVGIPGNERADELARKGASSPFVGPEPFCGISSGVWRKMIKEKEEKERQALFLGQVGLRQSKTMLGGYSRGRFEFCIGLSRRNLGILAGLYTGHCRLNEHLHRMGVVSSPVCRFCDEENESAGHILGTCAALMHQRRRYMGHYQVSDRELPHLAPASILGFVNATGLGRVMW